MLLMSLMFVDLPFHDVNLQSRNWLSLCAVSDPPPTALIREFYSNLSIHSDDSGGHYLTTWIRGEEFHITKKVLDRKSVV